MNWDNNTETGREVYRATPGPFTIETTGTDPEVILAEDEYSAANAFVKGELNIRGDLFEAIRFFLGHKHSIARQAWFSGVATLAEFAASWLHDRVQAAGNIRFHYDRSNAFYRQFLDSRMVYSAGEFTTGNCSLENAQIIKLDQICHHLDLQPGEKMLDVGCGWGALVIYAAERFGVETLGCTLSRAQLEFARSAASDRGLAGRVSIQETDYRDVRGVFDKIASIGMFEHVGPKHLPEYFRKVYSLLKRGGVFLNQGIIRPETVTPGPATLFLQRSVFPGGGLVRLTDVVREAERAGFEILELKNFRRDYALTCRAWVARLLEHAITCTDLVGEKTYRTWLLYLAASAVSFEDGLTDAAQVIFAKRPRPHISGFAGSFARA